MCVCVCVCVCLCVYYMHYMCSERQTERQSQITNVTYTYSSLRVALVLLIFYSASPLSCHEQDTAVIWIAAVHVQRITRSRNI